VENFLGNVLLSGYSGPLSLEIFNDIFREAPNRRIATDAMRSLLFLESQVRRSLADSVGSNDGGSAKRRSALERTELFSPPDAPELSGFFFLEFAVDDTTAASLATLLEQLGFRRAGRHRSKEVMIYRQGRVNLILNAQPDSFASNRFAAHGPSVCAIALGSKDPGRSVTRATSLHSARFESARGANELHIPAIRVPGGMIMHFLSLEAGAAAFYDVDFVAEPEQQDDGEDAGLLNVDHIALGLGRDELDTWVLFCRSVLGLKAGESLELADPFGLIRSGGLANADRSVRIVLNVSLSQKTRTAQAVAAAGGGSVHHIALGCTDIFESVSRMRAKGVRFVPISANYYDDLATRFDIAVPVLERMRELDILFDRSTAGDYFHIYTDSFADRFFFEIVQRTGAYDAYGALNAPARMASQAQQTEGG
jgi:4-hydroxyphenylpyruvate dioxygenase